MRHLRLNNNRSGAIVIIMQRLHEDDIVGHVLAHEEWEVIRFRTLGSSSITMTVAGALAMACSRKEQNAATDARQRGKQSIIPAARINASPENRSLIHPTCSDEASRRSLA